MIALLRAFVERLPVERARLTIVAACLLSLAGAWGYADLDIVSSRSALTDDETEMNRMRDAYDEEFGSARNPVLLVVRAGAEHEPLVEPTPGERRAMKALATAWADELRKRPDLFADVTERVDPEELEPWSLLYAPLETVTEIAGPAGKALPRLRRLAGAPTLGSALDVAARLVDSLPGQVGEDAGGLDPAAYLGGMEAAFRALREGVEADAPPAGGASSDGDGTGLGTAALLFGGEAAGQGYLFSTDGRLLMALAYVVGDPSRRDRYEEPMAVAERALSWALRLAAAELRGERGAIVSAGLAGEPALEREESEATRRDFLRSSLIALVVVSGLFMWGLGSVVRPALASVCLGMSVAWTFLFARLAIGHLNVLALVFTVILVALGIDFAIHFYSHYRDALADGLDPAGAIRRTYARAGGALWVGGVATATAFLAAWFTDFPGLSELGVIAGVGLLLCLLAMYMVFPAALHEVDLRWRAPRKRPAIQALLRLREPRPGRLSRLVLGGMLGVAALGIAFGQYRFDTNILALQPVNGDASRWQRLVLDADDRSQFALATYASGEELARARARLEALPEVRRTESVLPSREEEKRSLLAPLCAEISEVALGLDREPDAVEVRRALFGLRQTLRRYQASSARAREALAGMQADVEASYRVLGALPPGVARRRLARVQADLRHALDEGLARGEGLLCPPPVSAAGAPVPLRERFVGARGSLALRILPAVNTWEEGPRVRFLDAVRSVEPRVFGGVAGFHENTLTMVRSFVQAAVYSFSVIALLLLAWSRSVRRAAFALLPMVCGVGLLLGAMRWGPFDVTWNLANFFAAPILIGIGVAGGVHLTRAWALGPAPFRAALGAVTLSSLTTAIGFGLLATGEHRGVASLGLILLLGIAFNLLACLTALPIALRVFEPRVEGEGGAGGGPAEPLVEPAHPPRAITTTILLATLLGSIALAVVRPRPAAGQGAREASFLLVKPGDAAATPEAARDFLTDLGRYLGDRVARFGGRALEGLIANRVEDAARHLSAARPALAIVPPDFFLAHLAGSGTRATPVAEVPRFGSEASRWYLVVTAGAPEGPSAVRGREVRAPEEVDRAFVDRVVFPPALRPGDAFRLTASANLADDVFLMIEGDERAPAGLLLTEELKRFFEADDLVWPELRIAFSSDPVPWDLVVTLGDWSGDEISSLRAALDAMPSDATGRELLELMDSPGFEPVDEALLARTRARYAERADAGGSGGAP